MKKVLMKLCCSVLILSVVFQQSTAYAAIFESKFIENPQVLRVENDKNEEILDKITPMLNSICNEYIEFDYNHLEIGDYISAYNADTESEVYIYPIYANNECVLTAQVGNDINVSVSNNTRLFDAIDESLEDDHSYVLYIDDGIYYAQDKNNTIELEDTSIIQEAIESEFQDYSYNDKISDRIENADTPVEFTDAPSEEVVLKSVEISEPNDEINYGTVVTSTGTTESGMAVTSVMCNIKYFYLQGNNALCWAATVATICNYKNNTSITAKNVADKMGIGYDDGASASQTKSALSSYGLSYSITNSKLDWANVKSNISTKDKPFAICLTNSGLKIGHMMTGYGYYCTKTDNLSAYRFVNAWDPNGYFLLFPHISDTITTSGYSFQWVQTIY